MRFIQLHLLTVYPPSNPNRDDVGRPKTAFYGGVHRLRISSQSLKRAVRLSPAMTENLKGNMGERTQRLGDEVISHLKEKGAPDNSARQIAMSITEIFGKIDKEAEKKNKDHARTRQLAFISPDERKAAMEMADRALDGEDIKKIDIKERSKTVLRAADGAVDIAMFGRMLADAPQYNREAAAQVAHAITTHRAEIEDDYFTAADDLKKPAEDMGAGFVGEAGFGSGVYYLYCCINSVQLLENLANDRLLAVKALESIVEAFATSSPSGKRNSYGHHTRASFIRAEAGNHQPRSLAASFLNPVVGSDLLCASIERLKNTSDAIDKAYGTEHSVAEMDVVQGTGTLAEVKSFVSRQLDEK